MHAHDFQEPKGDVIWTNNQINRECTQMCDTIQGCPNYTEESK
jgi:hypothetical protein